MSASKFLIINYKQFFKNDKTGTLRVSLFTFGCPSFNLTTKTTQMMCEGGKAKEEREKMSILVVSHSCSHHPAMGLIYVAQSPFVREMGGFKSLINKYDIHLHKYPHSMPQKSQKWGDGRDGGEK